MSNKRIRTVENAKDMARTIDDFVTMGYKLKEESKTSAMLMQPEYGSSLGHIVVAILTIWWTFGIGNIIYLMYNYMSNSKKVYLKMSE